MAMEVRGQKGGRVPIASPNYRAIATMPPQQLFQTREMWIAKLCTEYRSKNSDAIEQCLEWVVALTSEMRLRGGTIQGTGSSGSSLRV